MAIYLDTHGHLHDHLETKVFLDETLANFRRFKKKEDAGTELECVLCLADYPGAEGFIRLKEQAGGDGWSDWRGRSTCEDVSLLLEHASGDRLWLIAGRQLVSAEGLEVLAIGFSGTLPADTSLEVALAHVKGQQALAVLPWGVGKWLGRRGRIVARMLDLHGNNLLLGDNGGRPWLWRPKLLHKARRAGVMVLPGSDPLRVGQDCLRNGSYGFRLAGTLSDLAPFAWVSSRLSKPPGPLESFGRPLGLLLFMGNQIAIRQKA